jgi:C2H2-type zinc finger
VPYLREKGKMSRCFYTCIERQINYVYYLYIFKVKTETALENHVKSHSGIRDLKCHICDAAFASRYTLNAHVKRHAITEPLFSCPYCGNVI